MEAIVLQEIAKQVGFVQRSSKFQANELIALCVWLSQEVASTSLTQLCSRLEASTGVLMSQEGLNQRFNPSKKYYFLLLLDTGQPMMLNQTLNEQSYYTLFLYLPHTIIC